MPHLSLPLLFYIALLSLLLPHAYAQAPGGQAGAPGGAGSAGAGGAPAGGAGGAAKPKAEIDEEGEGAAVPVAEAPIVSPTSGRPSAYLLAAKAVESQSMFEGHEAHVLYTLYNIGDRSARHLHLTPRLGWVVGCLHYLRLLSHHLYTSYCISINAKDIPLLIVHPLNNKPL